MNIYHYDADYIALLERLIPALIYELYRQTNVVQVSLILFECGDSLQSNVHEP